MQICGPKSRARALLLRAIEESAAEADVDWGKGAVWRRLDFVGDVGGGEALFKGKSGLNGGFVEIAFSENDEICGVLNNTY